MCVAHSIVSDSLQPPWTTAHQAPLSVEFFRQKYWGGLLFTPGNLPDPEIEPESPESSALAGEFFTTKPHGKPNPDWDFLKKINLYKTRR